METVCDMCVIVSDLELLYVKSADGFSQAEQRQFRLCLIPQHLINGHL